MGILKITVPVLQTFRPVHLNLSISPIPHTRPVILLHNIVVRTTPLPSLVRKPRPRHSPTSVLNPTRLYKLPSINNRNISIPFHNSNRRQTISNTLPISNTSLFNSSNTSICIGREIRHRWSICPRDHVTGDTRKSRRFPWHHRMALMSRQNFQLRGSSESCKPMRM